MTTVQEDPSDRSQRSKSGAVTISGLKLLLVEDSDLDAHLFQALIASASFLPPPVLRRARSIESARASLLAERPDCILLDLGLPDATGLSGLEALRATDPDAAILMLTGHDDDAVALAALRSGAQEYIVKDQADGKTLARAILRSMQRHQLVAELASEKRDADYAALHDGLTGLANRRALERQLQIRATRPGQPAESWDLVALDLDGFKVINDTQGHAAGDEVLKEVGRRLRLSMRSDDLAARMGGDEFVLLLSAGHQLADSALALRLRQAIEAPIVVGGQASSVSASIGIVHFPAEGRDADTLMATADRRMYADKQTRKHR